MPETLLWIFAIEGMVIDVGLVIAALFLGFLSLRKEAP